MNVFDLLSPTIREILQEMGFSEPTLPQRMAIPEILAGNNVLLIAPTGSGKTEAAVLPLLHKIMDIDGPGIKALYITPLRALNRDMLRRLVEWSNALGVKIAVRHGDTTKGERASQSRSPPDLLITTPETLQVMLTGKRLRSNLKSVRTVIVDEIHELASSKRGSQLAVLLERLVEVAGEVQRIGLSATVGSPDVVAKLLTGVSRDCRIIRADVERLVDFRVVAPRPGRGDHALADQLGCEPSLAAHISCIRDLVRLKKSLIFVNTRQAAEVLGFRLKMLGEPIGVHHGSLSREARMEAEDAFKRGDLRGLICTSSMELGIDIGDVEHVIQYSSPRDVSRLIQRVGRSGHGIGRVSSGTILATCPDDIAEACAIARRASTGELEEVRIHKKPLDVLANQLIGLSLDFREIGIERAFEIVKRSYPFRDLSIDEMLSVLDVLRGNRLCNVENGIIKRRRRGWEYYFENLSMIPDEKRYDVYDMVSRRQIGTLDEAFVVSFASPGATFVTRGEIWEIVEIEDDTIKVVPIQRSGEIPSWSGEEIPVPYGVAQEVGEIRSHLARELEEHEEEDAIRWLLARYPVDREAAEQLVDQIKHQIAAGCAVPDDKTVTIESDGSFVVINSCIGHRANDALGRAITAILSTRFGSSVGMEIDPYRIQLTLPKRMLAEELLNVISDLSSAQMKVILELSLKNTTLFRWKMVHVARKFGSLSKDIDYERVSLVRVLGVLENTPMYREAIREIYQERLDVDTAGNILDRMKSGEIQVITGDLSPIGSSGRGGGRDLIAPKHADAAVIELLKNRILHDRVILFCVSCKKWKSLREVGRVPDRPECPLCGSRMIAALKPWEDEEIKIVRMPEEKKSAEDKRRTKRVYRNANLVLSYGKTAAIALASRGLGPETAARVIKKMHSDELEFYRDILRAEREYARTKRFWGD